MDHLVRRSPDGRSLSFSQINATASWARRKVEKIEDLRDAVLGADFEAAQLASGLQGSVMHGVGRDFVVSSGHVLGRVALRGPLSERDFAFGVGLDFPTGTRQWLGPVTTGSVGIFRPADEHDAIYAPGSLYVAITMSPDALRARAEREGLVLSEATLRSRILERPMPWRKVGPLAAWFTAMHAERAPRVPPGERLEEHALSALLGHVSIVADVPVRTFGANSLEKIVGRARAFIEARLDGPLGADEIAAAARTSRRTLNRAFSTVLGESPRSYVLKLRLNRIRADLATDDEVNFTITVVSHRWGVPELGRLAGRYREMFGELPSETVRRRQSREPDSDHARNSSAPAAA